MGNATTYECASCNESLDEDSDMISARNGEVICVSCYESDIESASRVNIFENGSRKEIVLGNYFTLDDTDFIESDKYSREYIRTDGWRGYFNTTIDGAIEVTSGVDLWGETTNTRKLCEAIAVASENNKLDYRVYVVTEPTSNVFATGVGVYVDTENVERFNSDFSSLLNN